jgi:hypothetical protein
MTNTRHCASKLLQVSFLAALAACAGTELDDEATAAATTPAELVAATDLPNGHRFEVYDFGTAAIVLEHGDARVAPAYDPATSRFKPVTEVWSRLSGTVPPPALSDLEAKLARLPKVERPQPPVAEEQVVAQDVDPVGVTAAPLLVPGACGNVCCDLDAMSQVRECQGSDTVVSWFQFEKQGPNKNLDNVWNFVGFGCGSYGGKFYVMYNNLNLSLDIDPGESILASDQTGLDPGVSLRSGVRTTHPSTATYCGTAAMEDP